MAKINSAASHVTSLWLPHNLANEPQRIVRGQLIPNRQVLDGGGRAMICEVPSRFVKKQFLLARG